MFQFIKLIVSNIIAKNKLAITNTSINLYLIFKLKRINIYINIMYIILVKGKSTILTRNISLV